MLHHPAGMLCFDMLQRQPSEEVEACNTQASHYGKENGNYRNYIGAKDYIGVIGYVYIYIYIYTYISYMSHLKPWHSQPYTLDQPWVLPDNAADTRSPA